MLSKLALVAAAAIVASASLAVNFAAAGPIRPHGGGGGHAMHSASHSVGGRGFSGRSFAGTRSFRSGSFAGRAGGGRFALGRSFGGLL